MMYKIGAFSNLSKTPIKTLRYYEKEGLLVPAHVNRETGYRYYETLQLIDLAKILSYRQIGMTIHDIKILMNENTSKEILEKRKKEIEETLVLYHMYLCKINYLLEEENMNNKIFVKEIPEMCVYYKEGIVHDLSGVGQFVVDSGKECAKLNPELKCLEPDYCYVSYLDDGYKEVNLKVRYAQAVETAGVESESIKFTTIPSVKVVCVYHKGSYDHIRETYTKVVKYVEDNGYEISDFPRECYIDGCWNKDNEVDYVTEIQIPVNRVAK